MANRARGFTGIKIGGETLDLAIGLGALAELEDAFGVEDIEGVMAMLQGNSARKMRKFMPALFKGCHIEMTPARSRAIDMMTPNDFAEVLVKIMEAGGLAEKSEPDGIEGDGRPLGERPDGEGG